MPLLLSRLFDFCLDLIFPISCIGCGAEGAWLCRSCRSALPYPPEQCPFCPAVSHQGATCPACRSDHHLDGLTARTVYRAGWTAEAIRGFKYRWWHSLAPALGGLAVQAALGHLPPSLLTQAIIVPVPLHRSRERFRGFNQAELLARVIAQRLKRPLVPLLQRTRRTNMQAQMTMRDRATNVAGAFSARKNVAFSADSVILVDDVCTTGATLDAAAAACKKVGVRQVWAVVIARGSLTSGK